MRALASRSKEQSTPLKKGGPRTQPVHASPLFSQSTGGDSGVGSSLDGVEQEFLQLWRAAYGNACVAHALETITAQCARFAAAPR
jgi:hypothetical protein